MVAFQAQAGDFLLAALPKTELRGAGLYKEVGSSAWEQALVQCYVTYRLKKNKKYGKAWQQQRKSKNKQRSFSLVG